jgi:hypothetical protein
LARTTGLRLLCRYLCGGPGQGEVVSLAADWRWLMDNQHFDDSAWRVALIGTWRADDVHGEVDAFRRVLRERGLADTAPAGYRLPPRALDPSR